MKFDSVKISNILSFAYYEKIEEAPEAKFDAGINILIGPNGSGKSSFLEVLNQLMQRSLFVGCEYQPELIDNKERKKTVLREEETGKLENISKHWDTVDKDMQVRVRMSFNQIDLDNMNFVLENIESFNNLFTTYCSIDTVRPPRCERLISEDISKSITIDFKSSDGQRFIPSILNLSGTEGITDKEKFIKFFLERFEFIQKAIEIHNILTDKDGGNKWKQLARTFGIVGCYRNYNTIFDTHVIETKGATKDFQEQAKALRSENTRTADVADEPRPFKLTKSKLSYAYHTIRDCSRQDEIDNKMATDPLFSSINLWLKEYLQMQLKVDRPNTCELKQKFYFSKDIDSTEKTLEIKDLSSGEKGLFYFIMTFIAYDLRNGLMVIDEPELHLHPQAQKKILGLFEYLAEKWNVQFIIATHSPIFITTETIGNVKRFDIKNGASQIFQQSTSKEDKHLVRILTYTNSSKIFFSKSVILVEGECDEYFYRFFFDDYLGRKKEQESFGQEEYIVDVEFLSITGKGERTKWTNFLEGFGIEVYFIGDWDNVVDLKIISQTDIDSIKTNFYKQVVGKIDKKLKEKNSGDGKGLLEKIDAFFKDSSDQNRVALIGIRDYLYRRYTPWSSIIVYWESADQTFFDTIIDKIKIAYSDNVFLLQRGVLEDYLVITGRCDLNAVIDFCKENFDEWKNDTKNKGMVDEINIIFDLITLNS